jgi:hypothetical protein
MLSACNSNPNFATNGYVPYAPPPASGNYTLPQNYAPIAGQNPYFTATMPPGYPSNFYPFLPIANYFMGNGAQGQAYWNQIWGGWQQYAGMQGYDMYDFSSFWLEYIPSQWSSGYYSNMYQFYNQQVYFWVQPGMQFQPSVSPAAFWQSYVGLPYAPLNNYGYCGCSM